MHRSTPSQSADSVRVVSPVLQSSRLRRIIAAYTVNRLGTWFGFVALSLAVLDHTHSALAVAALLICGQVLPALLSPALVARVEASTRRVALSSLYFFETIATVALALLLWHFWLPAVLVLVALDGTAALAASALLRAAAARTAHDESAARAGGERRQGSDAADPADARSHEAERQANAALNMAFSATFMLGPALAGAVVAAAGAPTALLIDAATFLTCGAMLADQRTHVQASSEDASVRARLRAAWQHINSVRTLRTLLLTEALALVFFEFAGPIEVVYAKVTLHAGDGGYGLLLATWGAGVVAGSIFFARSAHRRVGALLSAGTLAVGLAYVGFAAAPTLALACVAALCGGVGNGIQWASLISAVQRLTPRHLHGRLMGAIESLGSLCPAIGLTLGGTLVALSSPRTAFLIAGIGAIATTLVFLRLLLGGLELAALESPLPGNSERIAGATPPGGMPDIGEAGMGRDPSTAVQPAGGTP
jgi:Transmembrane secretion effector